LFPFLSTLQKKKKKKNCKFFLNLEKVALGLDALEKLVTIIEFLKALFTLHSDIISMEQQTLKG
jgi:hypothetical protein